MKRWIYYYLVPLVILLALIFLPYSKEEEAGAEVSSPGTAVPYQGQRIDQTSTPAATPYPPPASNPRGRITEINYRDPVTGAYKPVVDGADLPVDVYHFNAGMRNDGDESVLAYIDIVQEEGPKILPLGAPEWLLTPGQEVYLFVQGANLKPAGKTFHLTLMLKERGTDKVLDQKTLRVTSR